MALDIIIVVTYRRRRGAQQCVTYSFCTVIGFFAASDDTYTSAPASPPPSKAEPIPYEGSIVTDLTGRVLKKGHHPLSGEGYSDVWKGIWIDGAQQKHVGLLSFTHWMLRPARRVAIKVIRSDSKSRDTLLGVVLDFGLHMSMACPWMENGSVMRALVTDGLAYLHARGVVHGDLTGANVLVNDLHEAVLCDFGLSMTAAELSDGKDGQSQGSVVGGAVRLADARLYQQSREALMDSGIDVSGDVDDPEVVMTAPSMASDIYSLGSVMLEILSGRIPYHYVRSDAQVVIVANA
ncbi:kinase-like protein [Cylindrobasidium torrendii FP15055 ss-10]|uniref:Kinase-like protein n=1 Tax=Cylindrobasidium torrendii FP15055 ss-10 TaxID=1314674 RepID=A0A0D7AU06_9AGAR|nr:kinase-like protein [Cylindrobasidium torrendii FP15055 ss-10]